METGNVFKLEKDRMRLVVYDMDEGREKEVEVFKLQIEKSYRGRPGCMCGCRGSYSNEKNLAMQRLRRMVEICKEFNLKPVMRTLRDGRKVIHLPYEIEEKKNVCYVVYLSP